MHISPNSASIPQPSVQNPIEIGLSTNGIESSNSTNLDGNSSRKKIFIATILILGLVGTAGYYAYDPYTEPECHMDNKEFEGKNRVYEMRDGLCYWEWNTDNYSIESSNKGDYYNFCSTSSYCEGELCQKIYSAERGIIFEYDGNCSTRVSDISPPEIFYITWYEPDRDDWQLEVNRIADEIGEEVPVSCNYIPSYELGILEDDN